MAAQDSPAMETVTQDEESFPVDEPTAFQASKAGGCGCQGHAAAGSFDAVSEMLAEAGDDADVTAPTLVPPEEAMSGAGATVWQKGKKVTGLWSINQDRNAWLYLAGIGWKRLSKKSGSGLVAMNLLGSHARDRNRSVNVRLESDGQIHEIYVF